jgi:excisionase family DNA binding protein
MRPENEQLETLLTVKDVAEILSVGVRTVWRWAASDKIPRPIRLAGKIRR